MEKNHGLVRRRDSGVLCRQSAQLLEKRDRGAHGENTWAASACPFLTVEMNQANMNRQCGCNRCEALDGDPLRCLSFDRRAGSVDRDKKDTLGKVAFWLSSTDH